ncbi:MAG: hypothetical protein AMXMBFR44_5360 [Candidatus Campbellbacteria bacterium]
MSQQNPQSTMETKQRLSEALHQKFVALTTLEGRFRGRDFSAARAALRSVDVVLQHFNPKHDEELAQYNLDRAEKLMLAVALAGVSESSEVRRTRKKAKKPVTGRFVGEELPAKPVRLDGPNIIGHITPDMNAALRRQRQLSGLEVPKRGQAVHITGGHKKRAGRNG